MSKRKNSHRKCEKAHEPRKIAASDIVNLITALVFQSTRPMRGGTPTPPR